MDTNTVLFLHSGLTNRISRRAQDQIESDDLVISSIVLLELEMLHKRGRVRYDAQHILSDLAQQIGLRVCQLPMAIVVLSALRMKWVPDLCDRLIVANAHAANEAPLITSDENIRKHYRNTVW